MGKKKKQEKTKGEGKCSICCVPWGAVHLAACSIPDAFSRVNEVFNLFHSQAEQAMGGYPGNPGGPHDNVQIEQAFLLVAENLADTLRNAIRQRERQARKDRGIYTGL